MKASLKCILAALLASLTVLPTAFGLVSCGQADTPDDVATDGTQIESESDEETAFFPPIEKKDHGKATFRMIGWTHPGDWYFAEEYQNTQGGNSVLNNTLYEMNTLVEEHLNVDLEYEHPGNMVTGHEIHDTVSPTIMSGDDEYQLVILNAYYDVNNFVLKNKAQDFGGFPDIDLNQSYWNREVMDTLSLKDRYFVGAGDLCRYELAVLYCNKDMLKQVSRKVPYDQVRSGEWTLDSLFSITTDLYADNGDGKRDRGDTFGLACMWDSRTSSLMQASDIYIAKKNDQGRFELCLYGDKLVEYYDRLYQWAHNDSTLLWAPGDSFTADFRSEECYFTEDLLGAQYLDVKFSMGILPLPKYSKEQANYSHCNWGNNLIIPSTAQNKEMVGQVLELMSFYSETMVLEKYYDDVLQLRVSESPDDRDMVELIYDTVTFDPGITYCDGSDAMWNIVFTTCSCIRWDNPNVTSYYKTYEKAAARWLNNLERSIRN